METNEIQKAQGATTTAAGAISASQDSSSKITPAAVSKQVTLHPKTMTFFHLHLMDYTEDEYTASFLTDQDIDRIQLENVDIINRLRSQSDGDETSSDFARGLEIMFTAASLQSHHAIKQAAIDAVMDEQEKQFDGGYCDNDRIAVAYMVETSASVQAANIRAASDARYVNHFVRDRQED